MVISHVRDKHASVCLLIPHKRTAHSFALIHKQRQTFPLLCRLLSFSFFYFSPFLSEPRKGALIHSPRNKPGGLQTTHRAVRGSLCDSFFSLFLLPSFPPSLPPILFPLFYPVTLYVSLLLSLSGPLSPSTFHPSSAQPD